MTILQEGYEYSYERFAEAISNDVMSFEEGQELHDTLTMFRCIKQSALALGDAWGDVSPFLKFQGYSRHEESRFSYYAGYVCGPKCGKFAPLELEEFDSGSPMREVYRKMLRVFEAAKNPQALTRGELNRLNAVARED